MELRVVLECASADSFEVFVADNALEGGAVDERQLFDDFELIGEVNAPEFAAAFEIKRYR